MLLGSATRVGLGELLEPRHVQKLSASVTPAFAKQLVR